jgi:hypothetical protein
MKACVDVDIYIGVFLNYAEFGGGGQLHAPAALPLEKEPPVPIGYEVGWTP